jgi:hypothetical protein
MRRKEGLKDGAQSRKYNSKKEGMEEGGQSKIYTWDGRMSGLKKESSRGYTVELDGRNGRKIGW